MTPAKKTVVCRRNGTGFGRDHRCAMAFAENCGLFEVLCHGVGEKSPISDLRGMPEAHLRSRLLAFHEGKAADATVMTRLMRGYDRAQIEALAKWFAAEGGR